MTARSTTTLKVNHAQVATIRLRLTEAILRSGNGVVTVQDAVDRAKKMTQRLLGPIEPKQPHSQDSCPEKP